MRLLRAFTLILPAVWLAMGCARAGEDKPIPAPAMDAKPAMGLQSVVLSGGCFWGVQGVFEHVKGVREALSGYAGGSAATAHYTLTSTGMTGHAESVKVTFDPKQVTLGQILRVFFGVAHDPTELNRQGLDEGTQYRSEIWYADREQAAVASAYIAQLDKAHVFERPIVTRVAPLSGFYPAETYHQDYLIHNPDSFYIQVNDLPKIASLKALYPALYREAAVMVASAH